MAFPAIVGFLVYLNEPLVLAGSVVTFIVSAIKYITLAQAINVQAGMTGQIQESMSHELENVMDANKEIVSSISTLSAASEEVLAETQLSMDTINGTFNSMKVFSETVDGTFEQLQILKETVVTE